MTRVPARISTGLVLAALAGSVAAAENAITAVPPARYQPSVAQKAAPAALLLSADAQGRRLVLPKATASEIDALKRVNAAAKALLSESSVRKGARLAIAFDRPVTNASRVIALDSLDWHGANDGSRAARVEVQSTDAAAVRVALRLSSSIPGMTLRFRGAQAGAPVFGPYSGAMIRANDASFGTFWSPVIGGDTAVIELSVPAGTALASQRLTIESVSHQLVAPAQLRNVAAKALDIGDGLPCETDIKCVAPSAALTAAGNAVAKITFQSGGFGYLCTGQLLNDSATSFTPYFFTANHCIDSAAAASTINAWWFFDATDCGSQTPRPDFVQQATFAQLLARSTDWDWSLVRLNVNPPAGAMFSAWRAEPVADGTILTVLHHPSGDLKKFSQGTANGYVADGLYPGTTPASFLYMTYTQGETEGGSSGSGLLTFNGAGGYYELRGGLYNGLAAACPRPAGYFDVYSRLDNMLPVTREYLTPGSNPAGTVAAVEFYNALLDHYFLSTNPSEINDLDTGVHPGWVRTGLRFNAYPGPVAGASPVCRFYRAPAYGDSHFYSASPAECAATAAAHPVDWIYESAAVFYIALPDPVSGACPAGTRPIWRFFNRLTTNHRYTAEVKDRDDMRADPFTWTAEGYGDDAVIMCSPSGS
jgi:hypothetical protein